MSSIRESLAEMEKVLTRRAFFTKIVKGAGAAAAYDRFGDSLFGATQRPPAARLADATKIFGAFGRLVLPVDEDPGWATFEPDITTYGLDTYIRQVFCIGNDLAFDGLCQAIVAVNETPPVIRYGRKFLDMTNREQGDYLSNILVGNFENDGVGDILSFGSIFMLLGCKQVFFQNFPRHLATPGAEYQQLIGIEPKAGWDIMGFRGPVGPEEEKALRARSLNAPELPGVDLRNPWI
jgi:hypothetical protein